MIIPTTFHITQSNTELSSHSGLALLGNILQACEFKKLVDAVHLQRRPHPELSHGDVLGVMTALIFISKPDYDAVKPFQDDLLLRKTLGLKRVPSAETLRNRLDLAENHFDEAIRELSVDIVRRFGTLTPCWEKYVPLDLDVTPFDNSGSHKEGVSRTYKGVDGFAPFMAYLGLEGYLVNTELREGKAHCQRDGDEFLRESIRQARKITDAPLLARLDSGNDALDNIKVCVQEFVDWLIKRNLRKEDPQWWLETAQRCGVASQPRPGKTVWIGSVYVERDDLTLRIVFEVTQRTTDHHGQILLLPKLDVNTWWTSLTCAEKDVIRLYHDHGTSEQFHSEIKGDMDLERLPSGKFATNNLILLLGMFAYNALRLIGQRSLLLPGPCRKEAQRRRLRSVLQDLIYVACRVVSHARGWYLSFGRNNRWFPILADLHAAFR